MKLKIFKPITPSQRNLIRLNRSDVSKKPLLKNKVRGLKNTTGKSYGSTVTYHKGGGHKKRYRELTFKRELESTSIVMSIEYDPFRSSNIASIYDPKTKKSFYILAPKNLAVGDVIKSGKNIEILGFIVIR